MKKQFGKRIRLNYIKGLDEFVHTELLQLKISHQINDSGINNFIIGPIVAIKHHQLPISKDLLIIILIIIVEIKKIVAYITPKMSPIIQMYLNAFFMFNL